MKEIEIDLSQPFEKILETVLALPHRSVNGAGDDRAGENELRQAIRGLYEAANGRQVETEIGLIPIAPPIAPFLKAMPFRLGREPFPRFTAEGPDFLIPQMTATHHD